jgi:hypothetical protein
MSNFFGSNQSKAHEQQQSAATNYEVIQSRLHVLFAAGPNGKSALAYRYPEVAAPAVESVATQPVPTGPQTERAPLQPVPTEQTLAPTSEQSNSATDFLTQAYENLREALNEAA